MDRSIRKLARDRLDPGAPRWASPAAAAILIAAFYVLMLASAADKSLTADETRHSTAGYTYWRFNDYRLNPGNGTLAQRIMAIPLLSGRFRFPSLDSDGWRRSDELAVGDAWFNRLGNDTGSMLARGRAACALIAASLAALVWWCARRIFGPVGAMLSLLLFILNPTVLANGPLMTSDTACALFLLAATLGLWSMLQRLTPGRVLASAVLMGALFVTKMSAILILPIALILVAVRLIDGRPLPAGWGGRRRDLRRGGMALGFAGAAAAHLGVVILIVWASFGFRYSAFNGARPDVDRLNDAWESLAGRPMASAASPPRAETLALRVLAFADRHRLLPQAYTYGWAVIRKLTLHRGAFLNGRFSLDGWRSFFPYTALVKTPLPVFGVILLAMAAIASRWRRIRRREGTPLIRSALRSLHMGLPLLALFCVYWVAAISSHLNIGHRHLLPTYPPLFIFCGAAAAWWSRASDSPAAGFGRGWMAAAPGLALGGLAALLAVETACRFPNYLSYFNVLAGGPDHAYRHLVDSSLDWGQDLPGVKRYIAAHPQEGPFYLSYFGTASPATYGIKAQSLNPLPAPIQLLPVPADRVDAGIADLLRDHPGFDVAAVSREGGHEAVLLLERPDALRLQPGTYLISATLLQWGPWYAHYEKEYQRLYREALPFLRDDWNGRMTALKMRSPAIWNKQLNDFNLYRVSRLAVYLRTREADGAINGSILIYHVSAEELRRAFDGPAPQRVPDPGVSEEMAGPKGELAPPIR
jgi:hypothetical protein